jgi:uridine kinase
VEQEWKTTVVKQVAHEYHDTDVTVISQDSYYKDTSHLYEERVKINFDHPNSIDFDLLKHLHQLRAGKLLTSRCIPFVEHNRTSNHGT